METVSFDSFSSWSQLSSAQWSEQIMVTTDAARYKIISKLFQHRLMIRHSNFIIYKPIYSQREENHMRRQLKNISTKKNIWSGEEIFVQRSFIFRICMMRLTRKLDQSKSSNFNANSPRIRFFIKICFWDWVSSIIENRI